jgi:hypothetical protein
VSGSVIAGSAWAQPVLDEGGRYPAQLAGIVYVHVATGERRVTTFDGRSGAPIWSNIDTIPAAGEYHGIDGRQRSDGRATYNNLSVDWGDIPAGPFVDGIKIGYAVPASLASRFPSRNDPNYGKIFGFNILYAIWNNENGQHDGSVTADELAIVLPFPDAYGAVPEGNAWQVIFDLEGSNEFTMFATDQDGDRRVDFGYGYSFRQRQHVDPRNNPPIPRAVVGPLLVLPGNAGGAGFPSSNGVEDALDWYNTFDADFTYNASIPGYELDPTRTLERSNFIDTFFFGGDPYASYYTQLFGSILGCPADFNGDGFVDFFDYDDYVRCFEGGTCPRGRTADINGDAFVDFFDYDDFAQAFEVGC